MNVRPTTRFCIVAILLFGPITVVDLNAANEFNWQLRRREAASAENDNLRPVTDAETWPADKTAVIVCDMWDLHHCLNATRRVGELAPRIDAFISAARTYGATVIHAPSSCMDAYADHPARRRVAEVPVAEELPDNISDWCYRIDSEDEERYPIDQSDGGEDDDLTEHAQWAAQLTAIGRDASAPWKTQVDTISISSQDYVSDDGREIWNILAHHDIENVLLVGVHTNMCVLGRPFGLRQMAKNGKRVALVRDLTDTMYNPTRHPYVSHFTGTDRIVEYIETYVCPTITSDQLLGGTPFRFRHDTRPRVLIVSAEQEYQTQYTLPKFAIEHLGKEFSVQHVYGNPDERNDLPGIETLENADVLLLSVRRRWLPPQQMETIRAYIENGGAIVGIRTANHAFCQRRDEPPSNLRAWREFDHEIIGGNYSNHHGNGPTVTVTMATDATHPILAGVNVESLTSTGSLYVVSPLAESTVALLTGTIPGESPEPIGWTNINRFGGRVFYTSLGHPKDFEHPAFNRLLLNALRWAARLPDDRTAAAH